ncbi:MAG: FtsW/RodA/SpoVE family cell cycle protein [Oscillospiraceae bacterium]
MAKIAVVLLFSSMICTYKDQMQTMRYGVVPFMVITGGIVILLMLEPHLSASIIIMALAIVMMFVGGIKLSYLLIGMGGAGALLLIAGKFVPYVHKRIVSWRDPAIRALPLSERAVAVFIGSAVSRARSWSEPAEVPLSA